MTDFLIYDLKVSVLIAVCYMFYRLLLERETLHRLSRVVLLVSLALSLALPLCIITIHKTILIDVAPMTSPSAEVVDSANLSINGASDFAWGAWLFWLFVIGLVARLLFLAKTYWKLHRLLRHSEHRRLDDGTRIAVLEQPFAPFAWMHTVVLSRADFASLDTSLLEHEKAHVRLRHSYDIVAVEILTALQWFNPVVWLLRQDLRTLHEYEADAAVLSMGFDESRYIHLLMHKAMGIQACVLVNGIGACQTKKRIKMMIKMKSPRWRWLRCLYIVPVAAISLAVTAETVTDYRTLQPTNEPAVTQDDDPIFDVCEEMPQFPGGTAELMQFLMQNVKYPKIAMEWGVQGRVLAQFVVEKDGSITNVKAIRINNEDGNEIKEGEKTPDMTEEQKQTVDFKNAGLRSLKDESVRVLNLMPKWTPAKQKGKPVRVRFTVPVTFRLQ